MVSKLLVSKLISIIRNYLTIIETKLETNFFLVSKMVSSLITIVTN